MTRTLLYDGTCGLCARSVQFILQRERGDHSLRFAPLQGETAAVLLEAHPELRQVDSVIWVESTDGEAPRVRVRSDAALAAVAYVGGFWRVLAGIARVVPRFLRDVVYDVIARTRYRVFGHDTACLLPTPQQRTRFLP